MSDLGTMNDDRLRTNIGMTKDFGTMNACPVRSLRLCRDEARNYER